jgi:hypothetical protein
MAKENSRELKMQIIFKQHPNVQEFHVTSDDQAFFQPGDAKNHAATLEDKEVEVVKRKDVLKKVLIDEPKTESTPAKTADKKAEAKADPAKEERTALFARIEELGGTAAKTVGTAKLKEKIAELEAAKAAEKSGDNPGGDGDGAGEGAVE